MNAAEIAKRIEAERREWFDAEGFSFELRRPTSIDLIRLRDGCKTSAELNYKVAVHGIKDWRGVKLDDLLEEGGDSEEVPFDEILVDPLLSSNMALAIKISGRLFEMAADRKAREDSEKKA